MSGLLTALLLATTYTVTPGTTIQAGINKAYPGDTVLVKAGIYAERVFFPRSGTDGAPITLRGEVDAGGNPLTVIDNCVSLLPLWQPAPEVGAGVYKRAGIKPTVMLWNDCQIFRICDEAMSGVSPYIASGVVWLRCPADTLWMWGTVRFWDDVRALYGVRGETCYIRFRDCYNPNTQALRATALMTPAISLYQDSFITIERLRIQGTQIGVQVYGGSKRNVVQDCIVRNGNYRVRIYGGSAYNIIRRNKLTLGHGDYAHWGEHEGDSEGVGEFAHNRATRALAKFLQGYNSTFDMSIRVDDAGRGNEICYNEIRQGGEGVALFGSRGTSVHDNVISDMSSVGVYFHPGVESAYVYSNEVSHVNQCFRLGNLCAPEDTTRSGFVYNNRCYNLSGAGRFVHFHYFADDSNYSRPPNFWFYHNSYAGGYTWTAPRVRLCERMKFVNNIWSSWSLAAGTSTKDDSTLELFAGFDYNFLGGWYKGRGRYCAWAGRDRHNQWGTDTMAGSLNHQVWPLGQSPDWVVPSTSTAYRSGLDLSRPFAVRGVTYPPLPGLTPGYYLGTAPDLGVTWPIRDYAVIAVVSPAGTIDSGALVAPACTVRNFGKVALACSVRLRVGVYDKARYVAAVPPGTRIYVTFPSYRSTYKGAWIVRCSTELARDEWRGNDKQTTTITVR